AEHAHRLWFVAGARPGADHIVDLGLALLARRPSVEARIADQVLASDHFKQSPPMRRVGATGININVVVRSSGFARIDSTRHSEADNHLGTIALRRHAVGRLGRERHSYILEHGVLHGDLDALALASTAASVECRQNADGKQHTGTGIAERHAGFERRPVALPCNAHDAPGRLRDHIEGRVFLVGSAGAKALYLRVDDARVDGAHRFVAESQPLNGARREILHHDIGALRHILDELEPALRFQIDSDRFLVGVEQQEIPGVLTLAGRPVQQEATRFAALRVFSLDDLGTEPGKRLGAGRTGLELRQVQNTDASKTARKRAVGSHFFVLPTGSAFRISGTTWPISHLSHSVTAYFARLKRWRPRATYDGHRLGNSLNPSALRVASRSPISGITALAHNSRARSPRSTSVRSAAI